MRDFLKSTIKEAGGVAKEYFDAGVSHKTKTHLGDLVTEADVAASEFLVDKIHKQFPDHQIHSEEMKEDINPGAEYEWVIDPIDGTRNFAFGISVWCNLVAVLKNGELYMSAIYNPNADELFFAEDQRGAYMNDMPVKVNGTDTLEQAFGVVSRADMAHCNNVEGYRRFLQRLSYETSVWMHNYGTMLGSAYLASGGADFFAYNSGFDHDNLPPVLLCREAGAIVTDSVGNEWKRDRSDLVIANPKLHPKVLDLFV